MPHVIPRSLSAVRCLCRLAFEGDIQASLLKYDGDWKLLFREMVDERNACRLVEGEKWFRWENTFFRGVVHRVGVI